MNASFAAVDKGIELFHFKNLSMRVPKLNFYALIAQYHCFVGLKIWLYACIGVQNLELILGWVEARTAAAAPGPDPSTAFQAVERGGGGRARYDDNRPAQPMRSKTRPMP